MLKHPSLLVSAFLLLAQLATASASATEVEIHFAPEESLDRLDANSIDNAKSTVDIAAYVLKTGKSSMLSRLRELEAFAFALCSIRESAPTSRGCRSDLRRAVYSNGELMHLKAYAIDGTLLRTGSANFSRSGETRQANDVIVIHDAALAAQFEAHFVAMWTAGE